MKKKLLLILFSTALVCMLAACGGTNTGSSGSSTGNTGSAPSMPSSSAGNAGDSDVYGGDPGYSKLMAALEDQGKIKVKAKYATIKADGRTGSDSMEVTCNFSEIALGDVQINGSSVTVDFTAILKNEKAGKYIEESQRIIATLQKDNTGGYTFSSARTEGDSPIVVKPITPFSVDLLYNDEFVLVYACPDAALEKQRDRILFNDSITIETKTGITYMDNQIFVPMTPENVKGIELLPYGKNDTAIIGNDFEFSARFKITLQNDVIVYGWGKTYLTSGDKWISDALMIYNRSSRTYNTATEVENL